MTGIATNLLRLGFIGEVRSITRRNSPVAPTRSRRTLATSSFRNDVTAGGPGLVAVGGFGSPVVLISEDGLAWARVTPDPAVFGDGGLRGITKGGPGLVAIGGIFGSPVVLISEDGLAWSRVALDELLITSRSRSACRNRC